MDAFSQQITVDAPVERVYEVMADVHMQARLLEEAAIVRRARIEPTSQHAGRIEVDLPGRTLRAAYRLQAEPPHRIRYHAEGDWSETGDARLQALDDGRTRLRYQAQYQMDGLTGYFLAALGLDEGMARRHLERVKAEAEGRVEVLGRAS